MLGSVADRAPPLRHQRAGLLVKLMRLDEAWAELAGLEDDPTTLALRSQVLGRRGDPASAREAAGLIGRLIAVTDDGTERELLTVQRLDLLAAAGETTATDELWHLTKAGSALTGQALAAAISLLLHHGRDARDAATLLHLHGDFLLAPDAPARGFALHNVLLAATGDSAGARSAAGIDRFIHRQRLLPAHDPLNAAAIAELKQAEDLHFSGERRPGRHLQRIEGLPAWGMVAVPALLQRISQAVAVFAANLDSATGDHRFVRARPDRARLASWAAIAGARGNEDWHTHDKAWLSGTYYLAVPPSRDGSHATGLESDAGAIVFGWPGLPPALTHMPVTGELVLFPSYQHHRTVPLGGTGERIALTFDVMPD